MIHSAAAAAGAAAGFPPLVGSAITTGSAADHIDIVLNGKAGTTMVAFGPQLSDADIAAVINYERNSWGNTDAGTVQPSDVQAAR